MSKKLLIFLIIGVTIIGIVGFIAWRLFTAPPGERGLLDILPFGRTPEGTPGVPTTGGETPGTGLGTGPETSVGEFINGKATLPIAASFLTVSKQPVASIYAFARGVKGASTTPVVRYVERATGHIYEADLGAGAVIRLTNTTIPRIHEAYFVEKGEGVIFRYLREESDSIQTWYGKITAPKKNATSSPETIASLEGVFLPAGLSALVVSPATDRIFYLVPDTTSTTGFIAAPNGSGVKEILSTAARSWLLDWPSASSILMTTAPSYSARGFTFTVSPTSGSFRRILGGSRGLTTLIDSSLQTAVMSGSVQNGLSFSVQALGQKPAPRPLPAATLPEKCVWKQQSTKIYCAIPKTVPVGDYPDAWYQGRVSFSDTIWLLDTDSSGAHAFLVDLEEAAGGPVDATHLMLDPEERYLYLINKTDGALIAVRIAE
jgi:hypothetical protein